MKTENKDLQIKLIARGLYKPDISKTRFEETALYFYRLGQNDAIDQCLLGVLNPR